jgi:HEPN domain-containing protein
MGKFITWAEKQSLGCTLVDLGYRDYIAARLLLNNEFIVQGLTLASSAVEKYLKALIVLTSKEREKYNYHLDKINKLKAILEKNNNDVTKKFDPVFLSILENAYKIRYYDTLKEAIKIGFYFNQFIGELDGTIDFLEKHTGPGLLYQSGIQKKEPTLYQGNFILNNLTKKDFMEEPQTAFYIHIQPNSLTQETKVIGRNIVKKYEGRLEIFANPFEHNWFMDETVK